MIYFGGFSGCYKPTPLKMNLVLEIRLASKQVGEILWGKTPGYLFTAGISSKDLAFMPNTIESDPLYRVWHVTHIPSGFVKCTT